MHRQNGARRSSHDVLGGAPENQMLQAGQAARSQNDEIAFDFLRQFDDARAGRPHVDQTIDENPFVTKQLDAFFKASVRDPTQLGLSIGKGHWQRVRIDRDRLDDVGDDQPRIVLAR